jgi:hypothetical protein
MKFKDKAQQDAKGHASIQDHAFCGVLSNIPVPWLASCELSFYPVVHPGSSGHHNQTIGSIPEMLPTSFSSACSA